MESGVMKTFDFFFLLRVGSLFPVCFCYFQSLLKQRIQGNRAGDSSNGDLEAAPLNIQNFPRTLKSVQTNLLFPIAPHSPCKKRCFARISSIPSHLKDSQQCFPLASRCDHKTVCRDNKLSVS